MTTDALLDTSVVIALIQERRRFDFTPYDRVAISAITSAELRVGIALARTADAARARMAAFAETRDVFGEPLAFTEQASDRFGLIVATAQRLGGDAKAHRMDRMIAAIAAAHERALLTLNAADLRGLDGIVRVERPAELGGP